MKGVELTYTEILATIIAIALALVGYTLYDKLSAVVVQLTAIVDELRDIGTLLADRSDDGGKAE